MPKKFPFSISNFSLSKKIHSFVALIVIDNSSSSSLLVLVDNQLDETWLTTNDNPVFTTMYNNACNECKLSTGTSKRLLQDHLDSFLHSYLKKRNGIYTTIHDKIFDYLSCMMSLYPEKQHTNKGEYTVVVSTSSNMLSRLNSVIDSKFFINFTLLKYY
jgi:hypothetical protein